jgi:hypothetical protein
MRPVEALAVNGNRLNSRHQACCSLSRRLRRKRFLSFNLVPKRCLDIMRSPRLLEDTLFVPLAGADWGCRMHFGVAVGADSCPRRRHEGTCAGEARDQVRPA